MGISTPPFGLAPGASALVVAPHPDDETLGPGGTVHRLTSAGISVHVLVITVCTGPMWGGQSDPDLRRKELDAACDALGVADRTIAWVDDERARTPGNHPTELVTLIESGTPVSLAETVPELMLMPAAVGYHQDHRAVHAACLAAVRLGGRGKHSPRIVLGYAGPEDIWAPSTESWGVLVDTTDSWPAKLEALRAHSSQLRDDSHPRSIAAIRAIDTAAGVAMGTGMAERFVPYRMAYLSRPGSPGPVQRAPDGARRV